ncbi:MAG: hypothetical protein JNG85_12615 [Spirochaetaceae bacterium]|nr:hypothetical protein [Spirochaetaceae bacterium]
MFPSKLARAAYRDSPLEAWYPEPYRELAAELAFARSRRRSLLRYPLLLLRSLRRADPASGSSDSLVGVIDGQGRGRAGLPPLPKTLLPRWKARYLAEGREEAPLFACRRGPGGFYLSGGLSSLFEYELARARGLGPRPSAPREGAATRECAGPCGGPASLVAAPRGW